MSETDYTGTWKFLHLRKLMEEAPISVSAIAGLSDLSTATVGRARRGECLKRETVVKLFDAIAAQSRYSDILPLWREKFLVHCGFDDDIKIDEFFKAVK